MFCLVHGLQLTCMQLCLFKCTRREESKIHTLGSSIICMHSLLTHEKCSLNSDSVLCFLIVFLHLGVLVVAFCLSICATMNSLVYKNKGHLDHKWITILTNLKFILISDSFFTFSNSNYLVHTAQASSLPDVYGGQGTPLQVVST